MRPSCSFIAVLSSAIGVLALTVAPGVPAAESIVVGPAGSGSFGSGVTRLPNGNLVVTDPGFDVGAAVDVGAVHLYRPDGSLIATLRGAAINDRVGDGGVVVLSDGNFVVLSPQVDDGGRTDAGAATWVSGSRGLSGGVLLSNSLMGSRTGDRVGSGGAVALTNGNYVVLSPEWDANTGVDAGAATLSSPTSGRVGLVTSGNSHVGTRLDDNVGSGGAIALANGNYVILSPRWDAAPLVDVGAATFGLGAGGSAGVLGAGNSLIGSSAGDMVGAGGAVALSNGNYVVPVPLWNNGTINDAGAVAFGNGVTGSVGAISATNALVGSVTSDLAGNFGVIALANGNYVVRSQSWDNGTVSNAGAVTFGRGDIGTTGVIHAGNSLIGTSANDAVGSGGVVALSNGNYVVASSSWDNGAQANAGAVTLGDGGVGVVGPILTGSSLVGAAGQFVGSGGVVALDGGDFVVRSPLYPNGAMAMAGAVTWCSGSSGCPGSVSAANSLLGASADDRIGSGGVLALVGGAYVVLSPLWNNATVSNAGAATFGAASGASVGVVGSINSLTGVRANDNVGSGGALALSNGNYVVLSPQWDLDATLTDVGAASFGLGAGGSAGAVSALNSLIGASSSDRVGLAGAVAANGNYVIASASFDNAGVTDAGAVTLGLGNTGAIGSVTSALSVFGAAATQGNSHVFAYDETRHQLAVGQALSNRVVLLRPGVATTLSITGDGPDPSVVNQPVHVRTVLSATPTAPGDGRVVIRAASGETCTDAAPTVLGPTSVEFSCSLQFGSTGATTLFAEFIGSTTHAYSGSAPEAHTTVLDALFANQFEAP